MGSLEVSFLSGFVLVCSLFGLFTTGRAGLQAYLHFAQLCGEREQSDEIRQRSYPRHDPGHDGFLSLRCYTGESKSDRPCSFNH